MLLKTERNYDFRKRLDQVHTARRDYSRKARDGEVQIDADTIITRLAVEDVILDCAVRDLVDYFAVSQGLDLRIERVDELPVWRAAESDAKQSGGSVGKSVVVGSVPAIKKIILATAEQWGLTAADLGENAAHPRGFRIDTHADVVYIAGFDSSGTQQGAFFLEDLLNFRRAPYLTPGVEAHYPLFSPRMVHSGYGLDDYPDTHLAQIAHHGFDSILVFVTGINQTPYGYLDFNDLCRRAFRYGLNVYMYSYLVSSFALDDPLAEEFYDQLYGSVFEACPAFRGVILVGESCEFPSKDPHTTGRLRLDKPRFSRISDEERKPSPGWWPCYDYPDWLKIVSSSVRKHRPDADIVFWTYNWGWVPAEPRLALIDNLPADITLQATFSMFQNVRVGESTGTLPQGDIEATVADYSLMHPTAGEYFLSEAERAHQRGLTLYTMCNTAGLTWDFGTVPYEPVPWQWLKRHSALLEAREKYGLSGLMESHHYGFWPSFISEMTKWHFLSNTPDPEIILARLAERDFGAEAALKILEVWRLWSEAITYYRTSNEDQYGPFRTGPSFPLVFERPYTIEAEPFAYFGNSIFVTNYKSHGEYRASLFSFRVVESLNASEKMRDLFDAGAELLRKTLPVVPDDLRANAEYMYYLGFFLARCSETTYNVKRWYLAKSRLAIAATEAEILQYLDELEAIAVDEMRNAEATLPAVKADSRLGWEPSMEYMCDPKRLEWKLRQVQRVIDSELRPYRESLRFNHDVP